MKVILVVLLFLFNVNTSLMAGLTNFTLVDAQTNFDLYLLANPGHDCAS